MGKASEGRGRHFKVRKGKVGHGRAGQAKECLRELVGDSGHAFHKTTGEFGRGATSRGLIS